MSFIREVLNAGFWFALAMFLGSTLAFYSTPPALIVVPLFLAAAYLMLPGPIIRDSLSIPLDWDTGLDLACLSLAAYATQAFFLLSSPWGWWAGWVAGIITFLIAWGVAYNIEVADAQPQNPKLKDLN